MKFSFFNRLFVDKKVFSWALYDWANSAWSTTVMAAFVPAFLSDYWSIGVDPTLTTARLAFANSFTSILVAIITPALGAVADQRGSKKLFCFVSMICALVATVWLAFIGQGEWFWALTAFGLCMIGFNASLVFYDSLLPSIADKKTVDHASSLGYALGYLGGGLLFLVNIAMCVKPQWFGLANAVAGVKASFISVAIWWLFFSIPLFKYVPEPNLGRLQISFLESAKKNWAALFTTFKKISKDKNLLLFLIAFWLYIDGVYTVMAMAVDYGKAIKIDNNSMMLALLLVQFIGFPFALLFSKLAKHWGCRIPILVSIFIYGVAVILATWMRESWHFFALAVVIGCTQGGVQALSRSLFAKMSPEESAGEYFGLFNLVGKFAAILGPILVGASSYLSGNPRYGLLGLLILFIIGSALLLRVKEDKTDPF